MSIILRLLPVVHFFPSLWMPGQSDVLRPQTRNATQMLSIVHLHTIRGMMTTQHGVTEPSMDWTQLGVTESSIWGTVRGW
eukprot:295256-Rhodomonas_salina.2